MSRIPSAAPGVDENCSPEGLDLRGNGGARDAPLGLEGGQIPRTAARMIAAGREKARLGLTSTGRRREPQPHRRSSVLGTPVRGPAPSGAGNSKLRAGRYMR